MRFDCNFNNINFICQLYRKFNIIFNQVARTILDNMDNLYAFGGNTENDDNNVFALKRQWKCILAFLFAL